jgi:outer membrane protein assembly factor BamB
MAAVGRASQVAPRNQGGSGIMRSGKVSGPWLVVIIFVGILILCALVVGGMVLTGVLSFRPQEQAPVAQAHPVAPAAPAQPEAAPAATGPVQAPSQPIDELTMFRGTPERNLSGVGTVPRHPKLLWRFRTKTKLEGPYEQRGDPKLVPGTGWQGLGWTGQPITQGGRVYFGSPDSYVYCLDAKTGKPYWYYPNHHSIKGSIAMYGDRIYHGGRDNKLHCYTLDGKMVWETRTGNDMDSNPVVVGNRGFIGAEDKHIYCFDPATGKILWRSVATDGTVESSPTVVGKHVIAGSDHGILYCCDAGTGKTVWTAKTGGDTDSTTAYWSGRLYVGAKTGKEGERGFLWCFGATTGKPIWHVDFPRGIWATPALDPAKKMVYVGCNNGMFYAFRMADGKLVWKRQLGNRIWSSAAVTDGCIVVGVRDGRVWCLDEDTGKPIWVFSEGFDIDATPCVAGGTIVIGSQNGWVYCIGEAPAGQKVNPHWFNTVFPVKKWADHNPEGIVTINSPAPDPRSYTDTNAGCTTHLRTPCYGPAYVKPRPKPKPAPPPANPLVAPGVTPPNTEEPTNGI